MNRASHPSRDNQRVKEEVPSCEPSCEKMQSHAPHNSYPHNISYWKSKVKPNATEQALGTPRRPKLIETTEMWNFSQKG